MITLLLDSTDKKLVVGLAIDEVLKDEIEYEAWQRQSEFMVIEIANILKRNGLSPKEVGEIVVSKGPGSYTGVRIALTIAKVYAYALNIPCFAVSSLNALKDQDKASICLINARSMRSYIGVYKGDECLLSDRIMPNSEVLTYIKDYPDYSICGEVEYLNLNSAPYDIAKNLLELRIDDNKVDDILALKAVYLKD
jgi:tRNA threonylcarbamoyl adenosine modification protein YeaZ